MNILKEYMAKNNYTKTQAAEELGVSMEAVAKWMSGKAIPYDRNRYKLHRWSKGEIPLDYWEQEGKTT